MTSPVVPGSVPPNNGSTEQRLRELEKQIANLTRKDLSRANVGQGGRLRALYGDGNEAMLVGVDPEDGNSKTVVRTRDGIAAFSVAPGNPAYGAKEQTAMRDIMGSQVFATDEVAGYGLSHPSIPYTLGGREELQPGASQAAAVVHMEGLNFCYNPAFHVMARVRLGHNIAGTSSINFELRLRAGATILYTSATQTESVTGVVFTTRTFERIAIVPSDWIGKRITAEVRAWATTPSDFGVTMYPIQSCGVSRAWYELFPGLW